MTISNDIIYALNVQNLTSTTRGMQKTANEALSWDTTEDVADAFGVETKEF